MPTNIDDYVHRIGRTGRVGNVGNALSFMNEKNRNVARELYEVSRSAFNSSHSRRTCHRWVLDAQMSFFFGEGGGGREGWSCFRCCDIFHVYMAEENNFPPPRLAVKKCIPTEMNHYRPCLRFPRFFPPTVSLFCPVCL